MYKICSKCKQNKSFNDFYKSKSKKDGLQPYCKLCLCKNSKKDYKMNNRKNIFTERANERRKKILDFCSKVRTANGCCICGENTACCLDFHHLAKDDKIKNASYFAHTKSVRLTLKEIAKCVVVCSNCHRKIHAGLENVNETHLCKIENNLIENLNQYIKNDITEYIS